MNNEEIRSKLMEFHKDSYGWALHCCLHNKEDAEDVLHTAYVNVLEGKARYNHRSGFKTWLFAVIKNTAYRALRKKAQLRRVINMTPEHSDFFQSENTGLLSDQLKWKLFFQQAFKKLPDRQKEILHLVFYHDMTLSEVGETLGISIGAVRKYYDRSKKMLLQYLEKHKMLNEI